MVGRAARQTEESHAPGHRSIRASEQVGEAAGRERAELSQDRVLHAGRAEPIRRIGVAFDGSAESRAAVAAALAAVHAFGAELEVITVVSARVFATPTMMGGPGYINVESQFGREAREDLDAIVDNVPPDVMVEGTILDGRPGHQLALRSKRLDVLVVGSRGYGLVHGALARGVSGRVLRDAECPVIAVPHGVRQPFGELFGAVTAP